MTADQPAIHDHPEASRYEAWLGGELAGIIEYRLLEGRRILLHTEVLPAFEGRGVGGELARFALEAARTAGTRVTAKCPFIRAWLERHPEYDDIATRLPGPAGG